ncbi:hypothetical protein [Nonomuraea sp. NPDC046570]|uniref:hypothetical protein n=1 Tax=Nonomuraea sp. NPDC046570 TaxID=3155255 RepID=UPI0033E83DDA
MERVIAVGGIAALNLAGTDTPASAGTEATVTVVAKKLDNPRGLAFGSDGALYVAESGHGGSLKCTTLPAEPGSEAEKIRLGLTGKLTSSAG